MKKLTTTLAAAGIALSATSALAHPPMEAPVMTDKGLVSGAPGTLHGVTAFKGIPFGAPPVGDLRWKPPQPLAPWEGVLKGDKYQKDCIQPSGVGRMNVTTDREGAPGVSEDCLYLNVWTPAKRAGEKLPVMVWIFGGAYYEGGSSSLHNEGDYLAAKGVVLVNFNYRLGSLGFLAHPELTAESPHGASGNYALMDSISALKWVQDNIEIFGGDPDNVTIFGESAGAAIAGGLLGSNEAKGLFHRAIPESGGWMGLGIAPMNNREKAEEQTIEVAEKLGYKTLAELRAMPAIEASEKLPRQGMIIDGWIIPQDVSTTIAEGKQLAVDILVGSNADEGSWTALFGPPTKADAWAEGAAKRWGDLAEMGMAAYPAATDDEARIQASRPFSDAMAWHMQLMAESQAKLGKNAYLYYFTHEPPYAPGAPNLAATHTVEIPYVFGTLDAPRVTPDASSPELSDASPREHAFANEISQYWVNFAATGNPNGTGPDAQVLNGKELAYWPAFKQHGAGQAMRLDADGSGLGEALSQAELEFNAALFERDVAKPLGISAGGSSDERTASED